VYDRGALFHTMPLGIDPPAMNERFLAKSKREIAKSRKSTAMFRFVPRNYGP
jgi:hypothetical protein